MSDHPLAHFATIVLDREDLKMLKSIRGHFGVNDAPIWTHSAFAFLDRVCKDAERYFAQAGEGAARNEPVPPSSANETPAARGPASERDAPQPTDEQLYKEAMDSVTPEDLARMDAKMEALGEHPELSDAEAMRIVNLHDRPDWSTTAALNKMMRYLRDRGLLSPKGEPSLSRKLIEAGNKLRDEVARLRNQMDEAGEDEYVAELQAKCEAWGVALSSGEQPVTWHKPGEFPPDPIPEGHVLIGYSNRKQKDDDYSLRQLACYAPQGPWTDWYGHVPNPDRWTIIPIPDKADARWHMPKRVEGEQPQQEPVAWMSNDGRVVSAKGKLHMEEAEHPVGIHYDIPLYSRPTPKEGEELVRAAQAVVDRWDTPLWKDVPHTGEFIARLRAALPKDTGGTTLQR